MVAERASLELAQADFLVFKTSVLASRATPLRRTADRAAGPSGSVLHSGGGLGVRDRGAEEEGVQLPVVAVGPAIDDDGLGKPEVRTPIPAFDGFDVNVEALRDLGVG